MGKSSLPTFNVFAAIPYHLRKLKLSSSQGVKSLFQSRAGSISLVALLGWGGASWLVQSAIAPQAAQAYTAEVEVSISSQGESYDTVVRRAEAIARAAAQRSFDRDILTTNVAVMVMAENEGFIAPVVLLRVSRPAWKSSPDPQRWATYFPATKSLLGFTDTVNPTVQPVPVAPQIPPPAIPPVPQQPQTAPGAIPQPNPQNQVPGATPPPNTANPATPQNQTPPPNTANPATPQNQTPAPNTANPAAPENQTPPPAGTGSNPGQNPLTPTVPQSNVPRDPVPFLPQ